MSCRLQQTNGYRMLLQILLAGTSEQIQAKATKCLFWLFSMIFSKRKSLMRNVKVKHHFMKVITSLSCHPCLSAALGTYMHVY